MTIGPEDLASLRRLLAEDPNVALYPKQAEIYFALADALEASWAERDALKCSGYEGEAPGIVRCARCGEHHGVDLEAYLEEAYREHGRLRARADDAEDVATHWYGKWVESQVALARVRELAETGRVTGYPWHLSTAARMAVLAALDAEAGQ